MLIIKFKTSNAAFADEYGTYECARILREIASKIEFGDRDNGGKAVDVNGNTIGSWELTISA